MIYYKFSRKSENALAGTITRHQFREFFDICFGMSDDTLVDRAFVALDKGITPYVTLETWINTLEIYLRGTLDEKITYAFNCYDFMGKGLIRRDVMIQFMRRTIMKDNVEDVEEAAEDLVDLIIKKMDLDHDGSISLEDFTNTVKENPMLLQCLGNILPSREYLNAFSLTFTDKINKI